MIPRAVPEIHEEDFGTAFVLRIKRSRKLPLDISTATAQEIVFMRPDGTSFIRTATLFPSGDSAIADGADGRMHYVIRPDDLVPAGNWFVQGYLEIFGGAWNTSVVNFIVFPNLISLRSELLTP